VAQIGAAIGREFSYSLLRVVSRLPEDELKASLDRLVASELVFQRGTPPNSVYTFKHSLVQDAAHSTLLRNTRQLLHAQIAETLEAYATELIDSQRELFARHYAEAGMIEKSVACWRTAGRRSVAVRRWRKRRRNFKRRWTSWSCCPTAPNDTNKSSKSGVPWALY
jgi:predicted ATPase